MSFSNPSRPRIPTAFMPPDWSPLTSQSVQNCGPPSPWQTTKTRCVVKHPRLSTGVFSTPVASAESYEERSPAYSIRSNLRELKQSQAALRHTKEILSSESSSRSATTEARFSASPTRSPVVPPSEVFTSPLPPAQAADTSSTSASLRFVRDSLRGLKDRQVVIRKEREERRLAAEVTARIHEDQHRATMVRLCSLEENAHLARWARVLKFDLGEGILRFMQLPWPVMPPLVYTPQEITTANIARFLLCAFRQPHLTESEKLQGELERWTRPDFATRVLFRVRPSHRAGVNEGQKRVCAALEKLLEERKK